jgi:Ca2+-binding RTX toxin-like protein
MNKSKAIRSKKLEDDGPIASPDISAHSVDSGRHQTITSAALENSVTSASVSPPLDPSVVQIIDTTQWSKSSPDPSGMAWIPGASPGSGTLLMSDSEIDETPFFRPDNLFYLSATGTFDHSSSLQSFTKEPTGIVFDSANSHLFISDDNQHKIFEIDPNNPGALIHSFSTSGFAVDCEDVGYDPVTNHLFIVNGGGGGSTARTIFETTISGTVVQSMLLPSAISDPEAIAYDYINQVFYVSGTFSADIFVVSRDGKTILDTITLLEDYRNPLTDTHARPKGLVLAPSSDPSDDPSVMSLWAADYGKDQVMDGRIFEISLFGSSPPPLFTANSDVVDFSTVVAGTYQPGSQYDALGGNDTVTLPVDAAAAAAAGFDPAQTFKGGDGNDVVTGGTLNDHISGGSGNDVIQGGDGNDTLAGDGNTDKLIGGAGDDSLSGGGSSDTLIGGLGNDVLNGGSSNDTVDFTAAAGPVTVNLALGTATGEGNDTLLSIERVVGSGFDDSITGNSVANVLTGGGGDDTILGGDGNDTLTGGAGTDQVFGEGGHDTLKWDSADFFDGGSGFDTLDANLSSADNIDLRGANFSNLERIQTGSGKDVVTLSLNDVLSDTADNQFVADLGSSAPDTLNIDLAGGWSAIAPDPTLGPTGVAAGISVSGMTAYTFTNSVDNVTVFSNAEVVNTLILSS